MVAAHNQVRAVETKLRLKYELRTTHRPILADALACELHLLSAQPWKNTDAIAGLRFVSLYVPRFFSFFPPFFLSTNTRAGLV